MLKRRLGSVFVVMGAALIISALLLFLYNEIEDNNAGAASSDALAAMQEAIASNKPPKLDLSETDTTDPTETEETTEPTEPTELTVVNINGYNYIGYLSVPAFEIELPIMDTWSDDRLYVAPCLQYGSPLTNDAVIAAHNYKKHFLFLHSIEVGESLSFTDMNGYVIDYEVKDVRIIAPTNIAAVTNSEHDLVLYTCTSGGQNRVIACCDRVEKSVK